MSAWGNDQLFFFVYKTCLQVVTGILPFGDFAVSISGSGDENSSMSCDLICQAKKEIEARNKTGTDTDDVINESASQKV